MAGDFPFSGATFDSRAVKPGMLFVALKGEKADGNDFIPQAVERGAAMTIGGPDALERLHALARDYRRSLRAKVVGVTGSAGKTTTKEMLKAMLSRLGRTHGTEGNYNNHIGLPMTILNCPRDAEFLVVEMGTNHPGEIKALVDVAEPDVGVLTSIGTAHLEFFGTQDGIAAEKGVLLASARDFAVAAKDNPKVAKLREMCGGRLVEVDAAECGWIGEALSLSLPGRHNVSNAALAFAVASRFGLGREAAAEVLRGLSLPGARWRISEYGGTKYVDDSYNANPDSMVAALDAFAAMPCEGRRIAVLGDMFELGEDSPELHRKVFAHAMELGIPLVIGVGEASSRCLCHLAYKSVEQFKARGGLRAHVSSGDAVLVKASHSMNLGALCPHADEA